MNKTTKRTITFAIALLLLSLTGGVGAQAASNLKDEVKQADANLASAKLALKEAEHAFAMADAAYDYETNEQGNGAYNESSLSKTYKTYRRAKAILELRQTELADAKRLDDQAQAKLSGSM